MKSQFESHILNPAARKQSNSSRSLSIRCSIVSVAITMSFMYAMTILFSRLTIFVALTLENVEMRQKRCICQKAYVAIQIDQGHTQRQFCDDRPFVAGFARMPRPGQCWYRSLLFRGVINFHRCVVRGMDPLVDGSRNRNEVLLCSFLSSRFLPSRFHLPRGVRRVESYPTSGDRVHPY